MARRCTAYVGTLAFAASLAIGSLVAPSAHGESGLRFRVGVLEGADSLDPARGSSALAREVWNLQYLQLTLQAPEDMTTIPGLADAWTPSADRLAYTYQLRDQLFWSDGTPITADDVVYSLERTRDEQWPYGDDTFAELGARALDARTVEITTERYDPRLPLLPLHVVPKHIFERSFDPDSDTAAPQVGSGGWTVVERGPGLVRMRANGRYWGGRPHVDEVIFSVYDNPDSLISAIENAEVDAVSGIPPEYFERLNTQEHITTVPGNEGEYYGLSFDTREGHPALFSAEIRRALGLAVDRALLVDKTLQSVGHTSAVPIPSRLPGWGFDDDERRAIEDRLRYNPQRAAELLDAAGAIDTDGDGTRELDGRALEFTISVPDDPLADSIAQALTESFAGVGVALTPAQTRARDLEVVFRDPADDPSTVLGEYACSTPDAAARWCDVAYDAFFEQQRIERDMETREALVHRMLSRIIDQAPEIVLFQPDTLQAFRNDRFKGLVRQPGDTGLVLFSASSPSYLLLEKASQYGEGDASSALLVLAGAAMLVTLGLAIGGTLWWRARTKSPPAAE